MAPPSSRGRRKVKARTRKPNTRKIHCKKKQQQQQQQLVKPRNIQEALAAENLPLNPSPTASANNSPCSMMGVLDFEGSDDVATPSVCSTPKARRFRIPEIATCPPAPKKQRVMPNFSLQRRPIAFFAPPDLELFFFFALSGISV